MTTIALLDPGSLVGAEVQRELEGRGLGDEIRLLAMEERSQGLLVEAEGEAAVVPPYRPGDLEGVDVVVCCGGLEAARRTLGELGEAITAIVLSPGATSAEGTPVVAGIDSPAIRSGARLVSPSPTVVALAHLMAPLLPLGLSEVSATVLVPVSRHGNPGLEALLNQSRQLLSFQTVTASGPLDHQLAFNVLPLAEGVAAPEEQLAAVLSPLPDLLVTELAGGIFHALGISLHLRFGRNVEGEDLRQALAASPRIELTPDPAQLGPVAAAGQSRVLVGATWPDPRREGVWKLWAAMDNLTRGGALNAVELIEMTLEPVSPPGEAPPG